MKNIKQFVLGLAIGIGAFVIIRSLLGLIGITLAIGLIYWIMTQAENLKMR